jgi:hypothetical protein
MTDPKYSEATNLMKWLIFTKGKKEKVAAIIALRKYKLGIVSERQILIKEYRKSIQPSLL